MINPIASIPSLFLSAAIFAQPNVLIILTDDQGYGDLGAHGNTVLETPHLDRLHGQSIRLTDFHVAPVCTPTRGELMTGRDAMANGAFSWGYGRELIHPDVPTLPEVFAKNGYKTGHFGKWHLGDAYPFRAHDRGFQESITFGGASIYQSPDYWDNDCFNDFYAHDGALEQYEGYATDIWFREAERFMRQSKREGKPFFTYLALNAPHTPLFVPQKYRDHYLKKGMGRQEASFFGMIANIDENMGRLEAFLTREKLSDNTLVVWLTDNGGTAGTAVHNAGMKGRKGSLYEGGHRVPCFIRWPKGNLGKPRDIATLTGVQDLFPTLSSLCRLKHALPKVLDGRDLSPLLRGKPPLFEDRKLVIQWSMDVWPKPGPAAVLWKHWRWVNGAELYDIRKDPGQDSDVSGKFPEIAAELRKHYEQWWARIEPGFKTIDRFVLGSARQNPVKLAAFDWFGAKGEGNPALQKSIRQGVNLNGAWKVKVAQDGEYEIRLHRWPLEADAPITAGLPGYAAVDTISEDFDMFVSSHPYPEGKALPIKEARVKIGDQEKAAPVSAGDKSVAFTLALKAGEADLQTWFLDGKRNQVCGAYYVYVEKK